MANVLVVDDNQQNVEQMRRLIRELGHKCQFTLTAEYVFDILENEAVDLMLLDVHLPVMNGLQLITKIRTRPEFDALPVVMITADDSEQLLADCFSAGAVDFIGKPIRPILFKARVQSVLSSSELQRQLRKEVQEHINTSAHLRASRQRLSRMLDLTEEGMFTLDEELKIRYLNQKATELLGTIAERVLDQPVKRFMPELEIEASVLQTTELLPLTLPVEIRCIDGTTIPCEAVVKAIDLPGETLHMVRLVPVREFVAADVPSKIASESLLNRVLQLELMIKGMWQLLREEGPQQLRSLNTLPEDMDAFQEELPVSENKNGLRHELVETLQLVIQVWERATAKDHIELAEESGLWTVYHDPDGGAYARTLEKYLSADKLPKNPRWRKVLQTAYFVLNHLPENNEHRNRLNSQIELLESRLRQQPL